MAIEGRYYCMSTDAFAKLEIGPTLNRDQPCLCPDLASTPPCPKHRPGDAVFITFSPSITPYEEVLSTEYPYPIHVVKRKEKEWPECGTCKVTLDEWCLSLRAPLLYSAQTFVLIYNPSPSRLWNANHSPQLCSLCPSPHGSAMCTWPVTQAHSMTRSHLY
jgi:hypothetical protein